MQFAMNASPAPRGRSGSVAFCNCSKQKSSISLDAAEAEVTLINDKKMDPTSTHFVFKFISSALSNAFHFTTTLRQQYTLKPPSSASTLHGGGRGRHEWQFRRCVSETRLLIAMPTQ
jgi:hypothetical protein